MKELYYATGNVGKFEMVKNFLASHLPTVTVKQSDVDFIEEQTLDLKSISLSKGQQAWEHIKKPLLVDDSGIYFHRYKEFPGVMTKFIYQSLGFEGLAKLYEEGDKASFITNLVFMHEGKPHLFVGKVEGILIKPVSLPDNLALPYTRIMVPEGSKQTLHESMLESGYSKYNPRILAMNQFAEFIK